MANILDSLGHSLDILLGYLGIHRVDGLEAASYILGVSVFLGFCVAARSAIRIAFLGCCSRK
jgi:hypothetical protein